MDCPTGGFPTLQHNELRDFMGAVLTELCSDVRVEPPLQPLTYLHTRVGMNIEFYLQIFTCKMFEHSKLRC